MTDKAMANRKKDKRTKNYKQNITQKTKDRAPRTPLKTMGELRYSGRVISSCSTMWLPSFYFYCKPGGKSWM